MRSIKTNLKLTAFFILLGIAGLVFRWAAGGRFVISKTGCPKGHLSAIDDCEGKSRAGGWQNSGGYFYIARGKPLAQFCGSFVENYRLLESPTGKTCEGWKEVDCGGLGIADAACYACDRPAVNHNTHYYLYAVMSADCSRGVYFAGSRFQSRDFADKISVALKKGAEIEA